MGSNGMAADEFADFLTMALRLTAEHCMDGAIVFACMDWRHIQEMVAAGRRAGLTLKNLIVWSKDNGGMGAFYRSRHELIFPFKVGSAQHINNFGLGGSGRYRTNVWSYPGANSFHRGRDTDLAMHPTVKPVALVADAIKDVSNRGDLVLDPFGGSGSTMIASEKTGRVARLIELDPLYVDVIVKRWDAVSRETARLVGTGETFAQRRDARESRNEP
jgi:DNA modification methylase